MTSPPLAKPDLLGLIDRTAARALDTGTLLPIRTEQTLISDGGFEFSVRWVSSLAHKDAARVEAVTRRTPDFNPFLPPDPALTVAELGAAHLAVLNKYPVIERHLLIVTREFEAQDAPLTAADFAALAQVMQAHGGLGFYNGGTAAGASQAHKHLQWIPPANGLQCFSARMPAAPGQVHENAALPWRHACAGLDPGIWHQGEDWARCGVQLHDAYTRACNALGIYSETGPMRPYNLLVTRAGLTVIARSREKCADISVNALGFAGSLFVRDAEQIERLRAIGPLQLLAGVAMARSPAT